MEGISFSESADQSSGIEFSKIPLTYIYLHPPIFAIPNKTCNLPRLLRLKFVMADIIGITGGLLFQIISLDNILSVQGIGMKASP